MDIRAPQRLGNADAALYSTLIGAGPMPPPPSDPLRADPALLAAHRTRIDPIAQRQRIDGQPLCQLVDRLLDGEGARRIARRAHGAAGARIDENIILPAFEIGTGIGCLGNVADASAQPNAGSAIACQRNRRQSSVTARADFQVLESAGPIACVHLLLFPVKGDAHRRSRLTRQQNRDASVIAKRGLGAEAASHSLDDDAHAVQRQAECFRQFLPDAGRELGGHVDRDAIRAPVGDNGVRFQATMGLHARAILVLDDDLGVGKALLDIAARNDRGTAHIAIERNVGRRRPARRMPLAVPTTHRARPGHPARGLHPNRRRMGAADNRPGSAARPPRPLPWILPRRRQPVRRCNARSPSPAHPAERRPRPRERRGGAPPRIHRWSGPRHAASGERKMRPYSMPGRWRSTVNMARPVTLARASSRGTGLPITARSALGGSGGGSSAGISRVTSPRPTERMPLGKVSGRVGGDVILDPFALPFATGQPRASPRRRGDRCRNGNNGR